MARVKYHDDELTPAQEKFIQELIKGETQRKAYLKAYPNASNWKESTIDSKASTLFSKEKVKKRYADLLDSLRKEEQSRTAWTREQSIETLRFVIDKNMQDMARIEIAFEEELALLLDSITNNPKSAKKLVQQMLNKKKIRRTSAVHNKGIVDAVSELNKMQGFNEENVNLNGMVRFVGEDELED